MDDGALSYRRYLDGDQEAFDEIIALFRDSMILFINGYVRNISIAEDIAMDVFAELIFHKKRYNFKSSLKTYMFSIARNKSIDYVRKNKRYAQSEMDENYISDLSDLTESVIKKDNRRILHKSIDGLKEDYKTVIYLLYFEELSYDEIACVMHKSKKQIDNLAYRAKKELKLILEKEGIEYAE